MFTGNARDRCRGFGDNAGDSAVSSERCEGGIAVERHKNYIVGAWTNGGTEHDSEDVERIRLGFDKLPELADELGTASLWLLTNTKRDIRLVGTIREAIGEDRAVQLERGNPVRMGQYTLRHTSTGSLNSDRVSGAILAVFPSPKTLAALDSQFGRSSVIVIEHMDDAKKWKRKWKPIDLLASG